MKLRLNIATAPQQNNRPFIAGMVVMGLVALIALVVLSHETLVTWHSNVELRTDTARLERQIQTLQVEQQDLKGYFARKDVQQIRDRADFLNSLIAERSFPWTKIFMDLEHTLPPGVRVVSISPKLVNGHAEVSMEIGATSDASKLRFIEAIENSKNFSDVRVDDEKPVLQQQAGDLDRIVVTLSFSYATNT
jgi:Tfp pilus assembly protein PilN